MSARDVILDVAEELFADAPPEAVSLRAVARAADVAPTAVSYHFGTKSDLLEAVFARRVPLVGAGIRERLEALAVPRAAPPTARDVVEAVVLPLVDLVADNPVAGHRWLKVFVRMAMVQHPAWVAEVARSPDLASLFLAASARALPELGSHEALSRMGIAMFTLLSALGNADLAAYGPATGPGGFDPQFVDQLVGFTAAGLAGEGSPGRQ